MLFKLIGYLAAVMTTTSFLPQALKTIKTGDTKGISFLMYLMFCLGVLLWVVYGIFLKDVAIAAANIVTFIFSVIILIYKIRNMRNGEKG